LRSAVGLDDAGSGLVLDDFQLRNVAIQLPCILADELVTFPDLDGVSVAIAGLEGGLRTSA
jgi:hypothetical protein